MNYNPSKNFWWNIFGKKRDAQYYIKALLKKADINIPLREAYDYLISPYEEYDWVISPLKLAQIIENHGFSEMYEDYETLRAKYTLPQWAREITYAEMDAVHNRK